MTIEEKMIKAYDCLDAFKNKCTDKNMENFIDIFYLMLFEKIDVKFRVSIGKRKGDNFYSWLSAVAKKLQVNLHRYNDEPKFVFRDAEEEIYPVFLSINLALIKDISIKTYETSISTKYRINFNYDNKFDYSIEMTFKNQDT
jgi:hypothetical protein